MEFLWVWTGYGGKLWRGARGREESLENDSRDALNIMFADTNSLANMGVITGRTCQHGGEHGIYSAATTYIPIKRAHSNYEGDKAV